MKRDDLIHIVRASAGITGERHFVIVGSQSILGTHEEAPEEMLFSMEADIYPRFAPEKADEIDVAIGDGSPFQQSFGYYAHGVGPTTAKCPKGWESRVVTHVLPASANVTEPIYAEYLEVHDLVLSKCVAGRDRDWEFAQSALSSGIVEYETLMERTEDLPIPSSEIKRVRRMLTGLRERIAKKDAAPVQKANDLRPDERGEDQEASHAS